MLSLGRDTSTYRLFYCNAAQPRSCSQVISANVVTMPAPKRRRINDLQELAEALVADARERDWQKRHELLRPYCRNARMRVYITEKMSPDELLTGQGTGSPPDRVIPLHDSVSFPGSTRPGQGQQRLLTDLWPQYHN